MKSEYYDLCYERQHVTFEIKFLRSHLPIASDPENEAACFEISPRMDTISRERKIPFEVIEGELISYVMELAQKMFNKPMEILKNITTPNCIAVKFPLGTKEMAP